MIYWFTGQPGSGKTVLADKVKDEIFPHAYRIDGDEMRELFANKDYSEKGRRANIDAAQKIAHYLHNQGKDVIVSLVSPYRDQREEFKTNIDWAIKEFFVHYDKNKEQRGREHFHVKEYQAPETKFVDVNTTEDDPSQSLEKIKDYL